MKSFLLFALFLGLVTIAIAENPLTPPCTWGGLGFNPYERWNVFSFIDIGSAAVPYGSDFEGRAAAGGSIWVHGFTWNLLGDNSYPFAATAGGTFWQNGGDAKNGGIQANGQVDLKAMSVAGDIVSTQASISMGAATAGEAVTSTGDVYVKFNFLPGTGSSYAGTKNIGNTWTLNIGAGKTLDDVKAFFLDQSDDYSLMTDNIVAASFNGFTNGDIIVDVGPGTNVFNIPGHGITVANFQSAARLLIRGPLTAKLIINIQGSSHALDVIDIYETVGPAASWVSQPTWGRLLLNFYQATTMTMKSPSFFTVLAPKAFMNYDSGVIWGNLIVKNLFDSNGQNGQVNLLPWQPDCPPENVPPTPPSPVDTGDIPSPPEPPAECPQCPWDEALGFNPWQWYNVFAIGNIGSNANPCGADFQGRVGATGGGWFKAFSLHDINQGPVPQFSASFGGDFKLLGGSIKNGGVEAGGNVWLESADIHGSVVALGTAQIGLPGKAVWVGGAASSGGAMNWPPNQSKAVGGFFPNSSPLSVTAPLVAIGQFFKDTSAEYAATPDTLFPVTDIVFTPNSANPNTIKVTLKPGINFMTLTGGQLQKASKLQITGDASGVLVINVLNAAHVVFDSLDVYQGGPPWTLGTSFGRVLVNIPFAPTINVPWGSGHWTLLAPNSDVTYISGVWHGNWIVQNLICAPGGAGGGQVNVHPWNPPCPECPDPLDLITCENNGAVLDCPEGTVISITAANYGRTRPGTELCPHASILTTACIFDVKAQMEAACDGLMHCEVPATNVFFGFDPCVNTYKYLDVEWICLPGVGPQPEGRKAAVQSAGSRFSKGALQGQRHAAVELPSWAYAVGAAVAGVALSALVVAGVALHKLANVGQDYKKLSKKQRASMGGTPTGTPAQVLSPSMTQRGTRFTGSP